MYGFVGLAVVLNVFDDGYVLMSAWEEAKPMNLRVLGTLRWTLSEESALPDETEVKY